MRVLIIWMWRRLTWCTSAGQCLWRRVCTIWHASGVTSGLSQPRTRERDSRHWVCTRASAHTWREWNEPHEQHLYLHSLTASVLHSCSFSLFSTSIQFNYSHGCRQPQYYVEQFLNGSYRYSLNWSTMYNSGKLVLLVILSQPDDNMEGNRYCVVTRICAVSLVAFGSAPTNHYRSAEKCSITVEP